MSAPGDVWAWARRCSSAASSSAAASSPTAAAIEPSAPSAPSPRESAGQSGTQPRKMISVRKIDPEQLHEPARHRARS